MDNLLNEKWKEFYKDYYANRPCAPDIFEAMYQEVEK